MSYDKKNQSGQGTKGDTSNQHSWKERWNDVKENLKSNYDELTDEDLQYKEGSEDELYARIGNRLGKNHQEVQDLMNEGDENFATSENEEDEEMEGAGVGSEKPQFKEQREPQKGFQGTQTQQKQQGSSYEQKGQGKNQPGSQGQSGPQSSQGKGQQGSSSEGQGKSQQGNTGSQGQSGQGQGKSQPGSQGQSGQQEQKGKNQAGSSFEKGMSQGSSKGQTGQHSQDKGQQGSAYEGKKSDGQGKSQQGNTGYQGQGGQEQKSKKY